MGFKSARGHDEPSDAESELEALRRQRRDAETELAGLKRTLSERVAQVQQRERELAAALARVEKREQKLDLSEGRGSRLDSVRLRLAEAKEARAGLDARRRQLDEREEALVAGEAVVDGRGVDAVAPTEASAPTPTPTAEPVDSGAEELDTRVAALADAARVLAEREGAVEARERELHTREAELAEREQALVVEAAPVPADEPQPTAHPVETARVEAKLAELRDAEAAFARTQHELAARSEALSEREAELAARERALEERAAPEATADIDALEARIRRLEQGKSQTRGTEQPTFSSGLRALQERGLRGRPEPDEPLH